ncbi:MAG: DNA-directed RNA polymerase sigma-70 factor [Pirellulaceae bacterium]|nr:MAG: DNA-directed RNA polymerase sigma-70 factor [Pirellulaceae bacterium]
MDLGSVSQWVVDLRQGEQSAAERLWHCYYRRLARWAGRLVGRSSVPEDGEDLAARALKSFLVRVEQGQLDGIRHRDDVWRLLVTIVRRKYANLLRKWHHDRSCLPLDEHSQMLDACGGNSCTAVTPEEWVALREQWTRIVNRLDDELRLILEDRLMGYTVVEIAARLRRSVPTVERRLRLLRALCREEGVFCPWE